jgi:hypothetical protein
MSEAAEERLAVLEQRLAAAELAAARAQDRGDVENVFNRYMHYHNAFEDERIIDELWVRRGTEDVRSQYNDDGIYTDRDTIMEYHRGRPHPVGKLILHYTTTPVIEVSADRTTAKGLWIMAGLDRAPPTKRRASTPRQRASTSARSSPSMTNSRARQGDSPTRNRLAKQSRFASENSRLTNPRYSASGISHGPANRTSMGSTSVLGSVAAFKAFPPEG